ncbi:MAG TPA: Clp protease N-terminal domain-containing protein [Solirubrobacteraceae bacterium]
MRDRRRTTALVLAGGVALAGTGFAIGSQSGGGTAAAVDRQSTAADSRPADFDGRGGPGRHGPGGPGLASLAGDLGVTEEKLREALDALRPSGDPDHHEAELAAALAKSLGVDEAKITAALEKLRAAHDQEHQQRENAFADALAEELGIEASKARSVLASLRPDRDRDRSGPPPRRPSLSTLARRLGVSRAKLRAALREVAPDGPGHHGPGGPGGPGDRGGPGDFAADLAKELGVDADRIEEALEAFHQARHDEFAQQLADKLGIDVDKVKDALPDGPGPGGPHGPPRP